MDEKAMLHDRGRGPELIGTRITVYTLFDYVEDQWSAERIAELFELSVEQVKAAIAYIRQHYKEVAAEVDVMRARAARGNPPHINALLDQAHQRFLSRLTDEQRRKLERITRARTAG